MGLSSGRSILKTASAGPTATENPGRTNYNTASSYQEARRICEPTRAVNNTQTKPASTKNQETNPAKAAEQRLDACDTLGIERGAEAHAECAIKLYINEHSQGARKLPASTQITLSDQQLAVIALRQAIQEATLKEHKRIQELEASLRLT